MKERRDPHPAPQLPTDTTAKEVLLEILGVCPRGAQSWWRDRQTPCSKVTAPQIPAWASPHPDS